ncbi:MAG: DUF3473 domain-containing protein [Alicyclobacillus sp.]|nr:DUF3473 domain-containing protein [Alicyclobacillus sp.]
MRIAFTVDVEDWYQTSDLNLPYDTWSDRERRVEHNTHRLLDLLDTHGGQATFFVLGCVAAEHPGLVREIVRRGHELACHGYGHRMLTHMTPEEIRTDVQHAKSLLEDVGGVPVVSYRAPSWSLESRNCYVLALLEDLGFQVDSSLQPFRTPLSGMANAPLTPFHPVVGGRRLSIVEVPSTVHQLGPVRYPFSGGLYLRLWPIRFVAWSLRQAAKSRLSMVYVHPWEIDPGQPDIAPSRLIRFTHYHNLASTEAKIRHLLSAFTARPLRECLVGQHFPPRALDTRGGE